MDERQNDSMQPEDKLGADGQRAGESQEQVSDAEQKGGNADAHNQPEQTGGQRQRGNRRHGGRGNHGKGGQQGTGRSGADGSQEESKMGNNTGLGVKVKFFSGTDGRTEISSDLSKGSVDLKGESLSAVEDMSGKAYITEADPTNLNFGDEFEDYQKVLAKNLNLKNLPNKYGEQTGVMYCVEAREELIAIPTLPIAKGKECKYFLNSSANDQGVITAGTASSKNDYPITGQFVGHSLTIGEKAIKGVHYLDFTPAELKAGYDEGSQLDYNTNAKLRYREGKILWDKLNAFENAKDKGYDKNPMYMAPEAQGIFQALMDINRDVTQTFEKAFICASEFMASISQDRYVYGMDQTKRKVEILDKVRPILDFSGDGKKINAVSDLINKPFLPNILDNALEVFTNFQGLYCYPKTTIAVKKHLQDLCKWSKKSRDHRSPAERCVLAYTSAFVYGGVSSVDGIKIDSKYGLGGASNRQYISMKDGNMVSLAVGHPIFDGIQDEMNSRLLTNHPWNVKGKTCNIPLTFDPEFPTFAFLVLRSAGKILTRLHNLMVDVKRYVDEGGTLPATCMKYPIANLTSFLKDAGYDSNARHNGFSGKVITNSENGNLRFRYPETSSLIDEEMDDKDSLYEYHPGLITAYTTQKENDELKFTGRFGFPAGQSNIKATEFINILDPVVACPDEAFRKKANRINAKNGTTLNMSWLEAATTLGPITVSNWIKSHRAVGLILPIPSCLVPFDTNIHAPHNGYYDCIDIETTVKETVDSTEVSKVKSNIEDALKLTLASVDCTKMCSKYATTGLQLSSHRLHFAVPVNETHSAHVKVSNVSGSSGYLKYCITYAYNIAEYTADMGYAAYVVFGEKGKLQTNLTPTNLIKFPFSWADIASDEAPYVALDKWGFHAKFIRSYTNPFTRIRETSKVGQDAPTKLVPHQFMVNDVFYWIELSSDKRIKEVHEKLELDVDIVESPLYNL